MRPLDAVRDVEGGLGEAGVPAPRTDAEHLVAHVLGKARSQLYAPNGELTEEQLARLRSLADRRRRREPLAYVLGEWGFRRLVLSVDRRVLVPRPETEVLVDRCLALLRDVEPVQVVDVGTGSGAIALAIADEHPGARVLGIDASEDALAVARTNAARTGLTDRVAFRTGDLLTPVESPVGLVVSNPPYVHPDELDLVDPEVRDWEPRLAFVGEGVADRIAADALRVLRPGGAVALECGDRQVPALADHLRGLGYRDVAVTRDLAGRERIVEGRTVGSPP